MRNDIRDVYNAHGVPHHVGLAYDVWAPVGSDGKVPDDTKGDWLDRITGIPVCEDYRHAFNRWQASFGPKDRLCDFTLASRLLVGHGNAAPSEVGLTVHRTWGVPVIPGSALKGLCAHYVETVYGPEDAQSKPWQINDQARAGWRGVIWDDKRIAQGPGEFYRELFGAPDAEADREFESNGLSWGASKGLVTFHDALYDPESSTGKTPFAVDVLTPHQSGYYRAAGAEGSPWPNDYDDPIPVSFLTVKPGAKFLIALSGPEDWVTLAEFFLSEALAEWGVGGKTAAGYGILLTKEKLEERRKAEEALAQQAVEVWRPPVGATARHGEWGIVDVKNVEGEMAVVYSREEAKEVRVPVSQLSEEKNSPTPQPTPRRRR